MTMWTIPSAALQAARQPSADGQPSAARGAGPFMLGLYPHHGIGPAPEQQLAGGTGFSQRGSSGAGERGSGGSASRSGPGGLITGPGGLAAGGTGKGRGESGVCCACPAPTAAARCTIAPMAIRMVLTTALLRVNGSRRCPGVRRRRTLKVHRWLPNGETAADALGGAVPGSFSRCPDQWPRSAPPAVLPRPPAARHRLPAIGAASAAWSLPAPAFRGLRQWQRAW